MSAKGLAGIALAPFTAGLSLKWTMDSLNPKAPKSNIPAASTAPSLPTIETGQTATEDEQRAGQRRRMGRAATILTSQPSSLLGSGAGQPTVTATKLGGV